MAATASRTRCADIDTSTPGVNSGSGAEWCWVPNLPSACRACSRAATAAGVILFMAWVCAGRRPRVNWRWSCWSFAPLPYASGFWRVPGPCWRQWLLVGFGRFRIAPPICLWTDFWRGRVIVVPGIVFVYLGLRICFTVRVGIPVNIQLPVPVAPAAQAWAVAAWRASGALLPGPGRVADPV